MNYMYLERKRLGLGGSKLGAADEAVALTPTVPSESLALLGNAARTRSQGEYASSARWSASNDSPLTG